MAKEQFIKEYGPAAQAASKTLGVDPTVILSQWGLETNWGDSIVKGTNNAGNIKDLRKDSGVAATDNATGSKDRYRVFKSPEEFGQHYTDLLQRKYPNALNTGSDAKAFATGLKSGGYAEDPNYVDKIVNVAKSSGESIMNFLVPSANAAELDFDKWQPTKPAAQPEQPAQAAQSAPGLDFDKWQPTKPAEPKKEPTFVDGAINFGKGVGRGLRDVIDGPALWAAKGWDAITGQNEAQRVSDLNKQAEDKYQKETEGSVAAGAGRVASNVGTSVIPIFGQAGKVNAATKAAGTVPRIFKNVAGGAAMGAADTRTLDESATDNALLGGMFGGVGGEIINRVAKPFGSKVASESKAVIDAANKHELPVSAQNIINAVDPNSVKAKTANFIASPTTKQVENVEESIARQIGKGLGVEDAKSVDTSLLQRAGNPFTEFDAATKGVQIPLNQTSIQNDLTDALRKYKENTLTPNPQVVDEVQSIINRSAPVNGVDPTFSPQTLQAWRSELGATMSPENVSPQAKQLFGRTREVVGDRMNAALSPEQQTMFNRANSIWQNKDAVEKMIAKSNNSSSITPSQMLTTAKMNSTAGDFTKGTAPYQDLAETASKLYGKQGIQQKHTLRDYITGGATTGMLVEPVSVGSALIAKLLANRALTSQNPTIRNAVVGNTNTQRILDKNQALIAAMLAKNAQSANHK